MTRPIAVWTLAACLTLGLVACSGGSGSSGSAGTAGSSAGGSGGSGATAGTGGTGGDCVEDEFVALGARITIDGVATEYGTFNTANFVISGVEDEALIIAVIKDECQGLYPNVQISLRMTDPMAWVDASRAEASLTAIPLGGGVQFQFQMEEGTDFFLVGNDMSMCTADLTWVDTIELDIPPGFPPIESTRYRVDFDCGAASWEVVSPASEGTFTSVTGTFEVIFNVME